MSITDREQFWTRTFKPVWERAPCAVESGFPLGLSEAEMFDAVVTASQRVGSVRFAIDTDCLSPEDSARWLPKTSDRSFAQYHARMQDELGARAYTVQVNHLEEHGWPVWNWSREFLDELYAHVGFHGLGGYASCFFGDYRTTPFGVHRDAESVFTFPMIGEKKIRTWPDAYVQQNPALRGSTKYDEHLRASTLVKAGPNGVVYWPADRWHVGESEPGVTLTLGVGVFRSDHAPVLARELFEDAYQRLQADFPEKTMPERESQPMPANGLAGLVENMPRHVRVAGKVITARLTDEQLRLTWMRLLSAGTLLRSPPLDAVSSAPEGASFRATSRFPILMRPYPPFELWVAANGHGAMVDADPGLGRLIEKLNAGEAVRAEDVRAAQDAKKLLAFLHRARAIAPVG